MNEDIIVAVYDTAEHAEAAVRDLEAAGVPADAIERRASGESIGETAAPTAPRERGFWASLFGFEEGDETAGSETAVWDRGVSEGSTVVTVRTSQERAPAVMSVLDRHHPVDLDERAERYGLGSSTTPAPDVLRTDETRSDLAASAASDAGVAFGGTPVAPEAGLETPIAPAPEPLRASETAATSAEPRLEREERIPLAEEQVRVGKRLVNRGATRVRRFVVETPVEETVALRSETAVVERRPATGAPLAEADFTDKVVEVTESEEEPVVEKTARVTEEVVVRKDVKERQETVRDTARREDVEIDRPGETAAELESEAAPGVTPNRPPRGFQP